jgi:NAD+ synthase
MSFRGVRLGVPVCEDIWIEDVCECLAETGAEMLIVPNGSPFTLTKQQTRQNVAVARVAESGLPLVYLNQIGGQDELVFDGASFVLNAGGALALQMMDWREQIAITEWTRGPEGWACAPGEKTVLIEGDAAAYQASVLGLRDYVEKNGFPGVVLGLSGGIDSALCAAIAVDALGASRVHCIMLPYKYTSDASRSDAAACADALGVRYDIVPIAAPVEGFISALDPVLDGGGHGVTVENLQSRTRGTILMAVSNETGAMLVTTGNKSEMSVGYATLYGDMNGGFNPIKDLYKTQVYAAARWRNANQPIGGFGPDGEVIPENIITKAPSAELAEDQTDQDTLPPYDALDDILRCKIEHEMPHDEIVARGHDDAVVRKVENMLRIAEYKRRQSAPGVKITERVFGRDWRYPITNKFREGQS